MMDNETNKESADKINFLQNESTACGLVRQAVWVFFPYFAANSSYCLEL